MLVSEYLLNILERFGLTGQDVQIVMLDNNLNGAAEVNSDNIRNIKQALYNSFPLLFASVKKRLSEGDLTIEWNIEGLSAWRQSLAAELGISENAGEPQVINISNYW